ncbi:hypothetical protein GF377_11120 [candidate division GN15 bacterium]|nr:hypothetical protein [candidate division GN15 bacterium]
MTKITIWFGVAFIVLGLIGYFATGMASVTALIPAFFGIVFVCLGWIARYDRFRKHVMHGAAILAFLAVAGSFRGIPQAMSLMSGGHVERPAAAVSQAIMAVLALIYVVLAIKSFVDGRREDAPLESTTESN